MKASLALCTASALLFMGCGPGGGTVAEGPEWTSMNGPRAQDVSALLLNADTASAILAGTDDGDVYVCARPGEPWANVSTIPQRARVGQFMQDPERPGNLYAATEAGLFASSNNGTTWTAISVVAETTMTVGVRALAIDPWNTAMMYTGTIHKGMRKSTDGGITWNPANEGIPGMDSADVHEIFVDPSKPDRILAIASGLGDRAIKRCRQPLEQTHGGIHRRGLSRHHPRTEPAISFDHCVRNKRRRHSQVHRRRHHLESDAASFGGGERSFAFDDPRAARGSPRRN